LNNEKCKGRKGNSKSDVKLKLERGRSGDLGASVTKDAWGTAGIRKGIALRSAQFKRL
jgi:hypothetical protein